ncbi:MAG TPA: YbhB/YbcL family Raf kinase inhibitor-like protein [Labilithrix sp.]|nr:YbhB/YbcL family Raf kinase inhibitor-like protein [Labilithrix sp.]
MPSRSTHVSIATIAFSAALACGKPQIIPRAAPGVQVASITVTSPSFAEGGRIPVDHTCDGKDVIPELVLSSPPENAKSLLLLVEDPDAPNGTFVHMVAFNVSPELRKLPSGTELTGAGETARFGLNDFQVAHYSGPCPPKGEAHRYRFRVLALDTVLKLPEGTPRGQIDEAIDGHIVGEGSLTGQFGH